MSTAQPDTLTVPTSPMVVATVIGALARFEGGGEIERKLGA
jgi:hypothetical protein